MQDFLLSTKSGYVPPEDAKYNNDVFIIWKVGKLVHYDNKDYYLIQERDNPSSLLLVNDGKKYFKIIDEELMLQKLQEG